MEEKKSKYRKNEAIRIVCEKTLTEKCSMEKEEKDVRQNKRKLKQDKGKTGRDDKKQGNIRGRMFWQENEKQNYKRGIETAT